eukprot:TRINITY_DN3919_c0_g1_i2.p1 TRINITY_DN3919_c0_g1~~TRINITY_DN3919_c0_g1_i2.p1  ORF type:complete len:433 (-),score=103.34 TRINITY_DN3919_c0_g1_i2:208-1506(-)
MMESNIHVAADWGHTKVVESILEKTNVNIDEPDADGYTPLHLAARSGHKECVILLIKRGAKLTQKTHAGHTPLDISKSYEIMEILSDFDNYVAKTEEKEKSRVQQVQQVQQETNQLREEISFTDLPKKEGCVLKAGGAKAGHWQKRYIVLQKGLIQYYRNKNDKEKRGQIYLKKASVEIDETTTATGSHPYCFSVFSRDRTYFFLVETMEERGAWILAIFTTISKLQESESSSPDIGISSSSFLPAVSPLSKSSPSQLYAHSSLPAVSSSSNLLTSLPSLSTRSTSFAYFPSNSTLPMSRSRDSLKSFDHNIFEGMVWKVKLKKKGVEKKRWLVIRDRYFAYFRKRGDSKPCGIIPIHTKTKIEKVSESIKKNTFRIQVPEKTFCFFVEDNDDFSEWMGQLEKITFKYNPPAPPPTQSTPSLPIQVHESLFL